MAVTIANLITTVDTYTGDSSTDRFSQAERFDALTEAVVWAQESHGSELQNFTYAFDYYDGIHQYNVTSILADLIMSSDLRKAEGENYQTFEFTDGKQLSEDIANKKNTSSFTIERHDRKAYVVINHTSKYGAKKVSDFESLTDGGGEWTADTVTSDITNLAVNSINFNEGNGSLSFDADVSLTANDRVSIYNTTLTSIDMTDLYGLSAGLLDVYIPESTNFTSVTLTWGTDTSNYWSATVTADIYGAAWTENTWQTLKFAWTGSTTMTGTPDKTDITYIRIDFNYAGGYSDATGFAVDNLRFVRPEQLKLYYLSTYVGRDTNSANIQLFGATTDTPFFSGLYDQMKYAVARYAASVLFDNARLFDEAEVQLKKAYSALKRVTNIIPSSKQVPTNSFKAAGINFRRHRR
jgi:hypothetical protein